MNSRDEAGIRWAPKVPREKIRRMYALEASGILDDELIDEVGCSLMARCESILRVTEAVRGRADCPRCSTTIHHQALPDSVLECPSCGWGMPWRDFRKTYRGKQLFGGAAVGCFQEFARRYPAARDSRSRLLLIDRLIHEFHWNVTRKYPLPRPTRAVAANLIEGRTMRDVVDFLNAMSGGDRTDE